MAVEEADKKRLRENYRRAYEIYKRQLLIVMGD